MGSTLELKDADSGAAGGNVAAAISFGELVERLRRGDFVPKDVELQPAPWIIPVEFGAQPVTPEMVNRMRDEE